MSRSLFAALSIFTVGLAVCALRADEEKVPLNQVPKAVLDAVKAKYPKADIVSAEKADEDGKKVYEFDLKEGEKGWEASFTSEGKFVGSEETITETDLPAAVSDAFKKKYSGAKISKIEKATTGEGASAKVVFEIVFVKGKEKTEAQFDPSGKFIVEEKVETEEKSKK